MEVIFAGGSHHGLSGYLSLAEHFERIYILSDSKDLIGNRKRSCDEIIHDFDDAGCGCAVLCGYGKFITKDQLERKKYVNVHESLLPKYRGRHPIFWAIANGEEELGITVHEVSEGMDSGNIIEQLSFPYNGEIIKEVKNRIDRLVYENLGRAAAEYYEGRLMPRKQNADDATYGAQRSIEDCYLDFEWDNRYLKNLFRALTYDYPLPRIKIRGESYEVIDVPEVVDADYYGPTGRVVDRSRGGSIIKTRQGFVIMGRVRNCATGEKRYLSDIVPIGYRFEYGKRH